MPANLTKEKLEKLGYSVDLLESDDGAIKPYDFKTPKRFTKDNVRLLTGVCECFAKTFATRLATIFRSSHVHADLVGIKERSFGEYLPDAEQRILMALIETKIKEGNEYYTNHVAVSFPNDFAFWVINSLLGGDDKAGDPERNFTELELQFFSGFVTANVVPVIEASWASYIDVIANCVDVSLNPAANRVISADATVLDAELLVDISGVAVAVSFCMPFILVEKIISNLGNRFLGAEDSDKIKQKRSLMLENIKESEVTVSVELGRVTLELGDILSMKPGDVMTMDSFTDSAVTIVVNDKGWFVGELGTFNGKRAVKILELL
ncbi:MAG: FliM/FliN family flagellar motor switch protein [Oscillospiraceae bacterium]|nr:FliM/FliN family flagellar motor switch protein [Oscillospiraceae bacterium]